MHNFPKYIEDCSTQNVLKLDTLLDSGMPWLKLNIDVPDFEDTVFETAVAQSTDWRSQWASSSKYANIDSNLVKEWNGQLLFGPSDWDSWLDIYLNTKGSDEDEMCKRFRNELEFSWRLDEHHPIRQFVESVFPDPLDINIVNFYVLPPGGFLFPHTDPSIGNKSLNKLYIPLRWAEGNEFGFYGWGNMPVQQGNVYLINNYRYAHWVLNRSNEPRVVLDIGSNLKSIKQIIIDSFHANNS